MVERVVLHIGLHKTGTTAFQRWADTHRDALGSQHDVAVFRSMLGGKNHLEFPLLAMRSDRNLYARVLHPDSVLDEWQRAAIDHIDRQLSGPARTMLVSAEGLSYLRHSDELGRLRERFGSRPVEIVVTLRDPEQFLRSYREEMASRGVTPSRYRESFAYLEPDSWLLDFAALTRAYGDEFGADHVHVVSYEAAMEQFGSTIPAVAEAAGLTVSELPQWQGVWLNQKGAVAKTPAALERFRRRFAGRIGSSPNRQAPNP